MTDPADEPVPKLPRGRGIKLSGPAMFRIAMTLAVLFATVALARPCGDAVSHFVMGFGSQSGAGSAMPKPGNVDQGKPAEVEYEHLRPGMTDEEVKAAIERAKIRASGSATNAPSPGSAQGSGIAPPTGSAAGSASSR